MPYQIIAHDAYLTLPPKTQVVLIDFIRHYDRFTDFGRYDPPSAGIPYSYGHCAVLMHRNTYALAIERLLERGFINTSGQMDTDGESTYYTVGVAWRRWTPNERQAARLKKLRTRVQRREDLDAYARCTLKVHPPVDKIDNPLLKFWARSPAHMPEKPAAPSIGSDHNLEEDAHAHGKQEACQTDIDAAVASLSEFRAKLQAKLADPDPPTRPTNREDRRQ